jgi:hypothetical protein
MACYMEKNNNRIAVLITVITVLCESELGLCDPRALCSVLVFVGQGSFGHGVAWLQVEVAAVNRGYLYSLGRCEGLGGVCLIRT